MQALISNTYPFYNDIIALCKVKNISLVHFINNPGPRCLVKTLEKRSEMY